MIPSGRKRSRGHARTLLYHAGRDHFEAFRGIIGFGIKDLISEARKEYDLVIVDGPEILNAPESLALATSVEGVVFVARAGVSSSKTAAHSLSSLAHSRANTIGIVMNNVKRGQNLAPYFSVQRRLTLAASN